MRIYIIGYMGSGKSTLGRPIAQAMSCEFVDLDHYIEQQQGQTIPQIFAQEGGQDQFRLLEREALEQLSERDNLVISTGGGTPCFHDNMAFMKSSGITVYLKQEPELLAHRLLHARVPRPLIQGKTPQELLAFIKESLAERELYYLQASIIVADADRSAQRVINILKAGMQNG